MKKRIDYLLLEILWMLVVTLGVAFWMTTRYAFNIFSAAHWKYLGELQATATPVRTGFYISLVIGIIIAIGGMYILVRPRLRKIKIKFPKIKLGRIKHIQNDKQISVPQNGPMIQNEPAQTAQSTKPMARPPRPNMGGGAALSATNVAPAPVAMPTSAGYGAEPNVITPSQNEHPEIRHIFESAGYTVKNVKTIRGFAPALFAIGANETLWIGGVNTSTRDVRGAINALNKVFNDTLDDIEISINGFAINAPDAATSEFQDILMFPDVNALDKYMAAHPNDTTDEDPENFDAYSEYIDTVIKYIGNI